MFEARKEIVRENVASLPWLDDGPEVRASTSLFTSTGLVEGSSSMSTLSSASARDAAAWDASASSFGGICCESIPVSEVLGSTWVRFAVDTEVGLVRVLVFFLLRCLPRAIILPWSTVIFNVQLSTVYMGDNGR